MTNIMAKVHLLSKYPSGHCCKHTAKSVTLRCAGAQVKQLSCPAPAQVSQDSWHGQQTPPLFGKLRGGHRLTHVLKTDYTWLEHVIRIKSSQCENGLSAKRSLDK